MSIENMKEYAHRCATEPELRARAKAIGFADPAAHIEHGKSLGLEFSMEDALAFRNDMVGADEEMVELGEDDLEQIAGGAVSATGVAVGVAGAVAGGVAAGVVVGAGVGAGAGAVASGDGGW